MKLNQSGHQACNLSQTLHGQDFRIIVLPEKRVNYNILRFPTNPRELYFHIVNIHTQGYTTLNKYIICIASTGLPKVKMWATKCVAKRL